MSDKRTTSSVLALVMLLAATGAKAGGEAVGLANLSYETTCAEYDNVYVMLEKQGVRDFEIVARHPAYVARLTHDDSVADFTHCSFSNDPVHAFEPKSLTLFEGDGIIVRGHTSSTNWRPEKVGLTVNGVTTQELHLVQVFRKLGPEWVEVLVVYPSDGYWRAKPLPPQGWDDTTYGSSFLIGPIEEDGRPLVRFSSLALDTATLTFRFTFAAGGSGTLRIADIGRDELGLKVHLDGVPGGHPFAALRSMFVEPEDSDVAEAHWQIEDEPGWLTAGIMKLPDVEATAVRFGRSVPSVHNTSAPDMIFRDFAR